MATESIPSALISGIKPMNHTSQLLQSQDCNQLGHKQNPAQSIFFKRHLGRSQAVVRGRKPRSWSQF